MKTEVEFYEGQKVNIIGIIEKIDSDQMPIKVRPIGSNLVANRITFDLNGRYTTNDLKASLFAAPEFELGEMVEVSDGFGIWHSRQFLFTTGKFFFTCDTINSKGSIADIGGMLNPVSAVPWILCRKSTNKNKQTEIDKAIKLLESEGLLKDGKILTK